MSRRASHTSFSISVLLSKKISGMLLSKSIDFRSVNRYQRFFSRQTREKSRRLRYPSPSRRLSGKEPSLTLCWIAMRLRNYRV